MCQYSYESVSYASLSMSSWDECVDDDILSSLEKVRFSPSGVDIQPPLRKRIETLVATPIHAAVQESIAAGSTAQAILTRLEKTLNVRAQQLVRHLIPRSTIYETSTDADVSIGHLTYSRLGSLDPHRTVEESLEQEVRDVVGSSLEKIAARRVTTAN